MEKRLNYHHYNRDRARIRKASLVKMAGGVCEDCGFVGEPCQFDFAHIDRATKLDNVTTLIGGAPWRRVLEEVAKCRLLCANCHRLETAKELDSE
jgi:hypothetical protein